MNKFVLCLILSLFPPNFLIMLILIKYMGFSGGSDGKESTRSAGDPGLTPGLGRIPEEGNNNPLQYSCLENPMNREAWQATVIGSQ